MKKKLKNIMKNDVTNIKERKNKIIIIVPTNREETYLKVIPGSWIKA